MDVNQTRMILEPNVLQSADKRRTQRPPQHARDDYGTRLEEAITLFFEELIALCLRSRMHPNIDWAPRRRIPDTALNPSRPLDETGTRHGTSFLKSF